MLAPFCGLAESPRFAHQTWSWLDIQDKNFYTLPLSQANRNENPHALPLPDEIGCVLPSQQAGVYFGLGRQGVWKIECSGKPTVQILQAAPFDSSTHRYNDGRADAMGRIWVSTLVDARQPASAGLYCIEGGRASLKLPGLIVGNGLAFSPDNRWLYLSDTRHKCVWRFDFDLKTGALGERHLLKQYGKGTERPDGACCTTDGSYWVAVYEGHRIDRFAPDGTLAESIHIPLARPTMPAFGGPDLRTLLLTAAAPDADHANTTGFEKVSVIHCETHFSGLPEALATH